jgi:hypothetical protein
LVNCNKTIAHDALGQLIPTDSFSCSPIVQVKNKLFLGLSGSAWKPCTLCLPDITTATAIGGFSNDLSLAIIHEILQYHTPWYILLALDISFGHCTVCWQPPYSYCLYSHYPSVELQCQVYCLNHTTENSYQHWSLDELHFFFEPQWFEMGQLSSYSFIGINISEEEGEQQLLTQDSLMHNCGNITVSQLPGFILGKAVLPQHWMETYCYDSVSNLWLGMTYVSRVE